MTYLNTSWNDVSYATTQVFTNTTILGLNWIIGLILVAIICVLITRDPKKMGVMALPTAIILINEGTIIDTVILIALSIVYVLNTVTINQITTGITGVTGYIKEQVARTNYGISRANTRLERTQIEQGRIGLVL